MMDCQLFISCNKVVIMKYKWQAKSIDTVWSLDHNLGVAHGRGDWKNGVRNSKKSRLIKFYQMDDRDDGHSDDKYHVP